MLIWQEKIWFLSRKYEIGKKNINSQENTKLKKIKSGISFFSRQY